MKMLQLALAAEEGRCRLWKYEENKNADLCTFCWSSDVDTVEEIYAEGCLANIVYFCLLLSYSAGHNLNQSLMSDPDVFSH